MLDKPQIQQQLHTNKVIIHAIEDEQRVLKRDSRRFFVQADPKEGELGRQAFVSLNLCRDMLRENKVFLKKLATIQRQLKQMMKG